MEPWDLTVAGWEASGLKSDFTKKMKTPPVPTEIGFLPKDREIEPYEHYYMTVLADEVFELEKEIGYDPLVRMAFRIPFLSYEEKVLEEDDETFVRRDVDGWQRRYYKHKTVETSLDAIPVKPIVWDEESWENTRHIRWRLIGNTVPMKTWKKMYGKYRKISESGEYPIRFRLMGFFWILRDLMDNEPMLYAWYDYPEMIRDIHRFQLDIYKEQMDKILKIVKPGVLFFEEDLSGKTGPMISPDTFDEFLRPCYEEIIPFLKERGVGHVIVDTDGDFTKLIPNFMESGVDGFTD